jgi:hypothetical protein
MTFRAKVQGPSVKSVFGADIFLVESAASVKDVDGVLVITTLPYPGRPGLEQGEDPTRPSVSYPARKATRGSVVAYPRGGWDKVTITDYVEEGEDA